MAFDPLELAFIRALRGLQRDHILAFLDVCHPVDIPPDEVIVVEGGIDDFVASIFQECRFDAARNAVPAVEKKDSRHFSPCFLLIAFVPKSATRLVGKYNQSW